MKNPNKSRVKREMARLQALLRTELDIAERLGIAAALYALQWQDSIGRQWMDDLLEPSKKILQKPIDTPAESSVS